MKRRILIWALLVFVALVCVTRMFWLREYQVHTSSMEPTILGSRGSGEHVLVAFDDAYVPERFELVVVSVPDREDPLVKRVAGLPSESIEIRGGDLLVDGHHLPPEDLRPAPILMFDDTLLELEDWFRMGSTDANPWHREAELWQLEAEGVPRGSNGGMMFLKDELRDGYLLADGTSQPGEVRVHDAILACEVRIDDPPAIVRMGLHEKGDAFEFSITPAEDGQADLRLTRRAAGSPLEELAEDRVAFSAATWHELAFSNVDNALSARIDGVEVLAATYDENVPHPDEVRRQAIQMQSYGYRVSLGGEAGRASFRAIRIWRDLHYTPGGTFAVREPLQLGPRELFVLGDNSSNSVDGRFWGPNPLDSLIGHPLWVIWPPGRTRALHGAQQPAGYPVR